MTEKYCVDCKWYKLDRYKTVAWWYEKSFCIHHKNKNLVSGELEQRECELERNSVYVKNSCGTQARYFEPKEKGVEG